MAMTVSEIKTTTSQKMDKVVSHLKDEFAKLRTGRANVAMVEDINFDYYGQATPLKQAAALSTPNPQSILIEPWDKGVLKLIEKALSDSNLGLSPQSDGKSIRLNIPALTEDRKKEIVKKASKETEDSKASLRNIRRDINNEIKKAAKDSEIGEDEEKRLLDQVQVITIDYNKKLEEVFKAKEQDIMTV